VDIFDGKEGWTQVHIEEDEVGIRMRRETASQLVKELNDGTWVILSSPTIARQFTMKLQEAIQ
jgi:flavorubredoxin